MKRIKCDFEMPLDQQRSYHSLFNIKSVRKSLIDNQIQ